jgi:hypothetical protein
MRTNEKAEKKKGTERRNELRLTAFHPVSRSENAYVSVANKA